MALKDAFENVPAAGEMLSVADGVWWLRMPLPFNLDHINLYLLEDDDGWLLIDSGINSPETRALWRQLADRALGGWPLKRLLATHYHPDHIGLAGWLCCQWDMPLMTSAPEYRAAEGYLQFVAAGAEVIEAQRASLLRKGLDEAQCDQALKAIAQAAQGYGELPGSYEVISEGDCLLIGGREWQVRLANGHSPAHITLYCAALGVLISGDQVLPRISSNVSVQPHQQDTNPLKHWLESLQRLKALPSDTLVLPSHDEPFFGLHSRLDALAAGHQRMLDNLKQWLHVPQTLSQLTHRLYNRPLKYFDLVLATGECQAHVNYLIQAGLVCRLDDEDGIALYQRC
ncbi:MBL fold metallo-hydrolase [Marinobacterium jannaschii]|uniref:MBL fold metallo-hydrolase n=1 Tax=Marinobacterium jannaschii TaxID=64970 RepID=UPI00055B3172|nr:MBL fold metallo-hydrolase [Marinobacterium jannaschii]